MRRPHVVVEWCGCCPRFGKGRRCICWSELRAGDRSPARRIYSKMNWACKLAAPVEAATPSEWSHMATSLFQHLSVARARFIEDLVIEQAAHGVSQYVILGAGLDTFARRRPDIASRFAGIRNRSTWPSGMEAASPIDIGLEFQNGGGLCRLLRGWPALVAKRLADAADFERRPACGMASTGQHVSQRRKRTRLRCVMSWRQWLQAPRWR